MQPHIAINTLCFANPDLGAAIDQIARIGVRGITPDLEQVLLLGTAQNVRQLRDGELSVAGLTHRAFGFPNEDLAAQSRDQLDQTIAVADEIGAPTIVLTTGGRGTLSWPEAAAVFSEAIAPCAAYARTAGIKLAIEPTSHLYADVSIAQRLADTAQLANMAGIEVPLGRLIAGITSAGYRGWFDLEVIGPRLWAEGEAMGLTRAVRALSAMLQPEH